MSWPQSTIDEACLLITDGTHYTPPDVGEGVPFLTVKDFTHAGQIDLVGCSHITEEEFEKADKGNSVPKQGDVLFSKDGTVGKVYVLDNKERFAVLSSLAILRPDAMRLDASYFGWVLRTDSCFDQASRSKTGSAIRRIIIKDLKRLKFPLPSLVEQKRIAKILDAADALRAKRQESLAQLDTLLQSTFLNMFGDPVTNPMGWEMVPITEAVDGKHGIKAGPFGSALKKEDYVVTGFRIYGQEQVIAGRFDIGDYYIDDRKFKKLKNCAVSVGDILVSLVGSYGKVLIVPEGIEPGIINPRLLKITPWLELVTSLYLATLIQSEATQRKLESMSHGGTMGILNVGLLKQLMIPIPPPRSPTPICRHRRSRRTTEGQPAYPLGRTRHTLCLSSIPCLPRRPLNKWKSPQTSRS